MKRLSVIVCHTNLLVVQFMSKAMEKPDQHVVMDKDQKKKRTVTKESMELSGKATEKMVSEAIGAESEEDPFHTDGEVDHQIEPKRKGKKSANARSFHFIILEFHNTKKRYYDLVYSCSEKSVVKKTENVNNR